VIIQYTFTGVLSIGFANIFKNILCYLRRPHAEAWIEISPYAFGLSELVTVCPAALPAGFTRRYSAISQYTLCRLLR
jgi:hypothetical protein